MLDELWFIFHLQIMHNSSHSKIFLKIAYDSKQIFEDIADNRDLVEGKIYEELETPGMFLMHTPYRKYDNIKKSLVCEERMVFLTF